MPECLPLRSTGRQVNGRSDLEQHDAEREDIGSAERSGALIDVVGEELRSKVLGIPLSSIVHLVFDRGLPEIANFEVPIVSNQNVLRLDIQMHDILGMHLHKAQCNIC